MTTSLKEIFAVDKREKGGRAESRLDTASKLTCPERRRRGREALTMRRSWGQETGITSMTEL